jgi:hypothetical protein
MMMVFGICVSEASKKAVQTIFEESNGQDINIKKLEAHYSSNLTALFNFLVSF